MSVEASPASTTSAPARQAPTANAAASDGEDSRMSCATTMRLTPSPPARSVCTSAAPNASAMVSLSWSGTMPRTSYALTMRLRSDTSTSLVVEQVAGPGRPRLADKASSSGRDDPQVAAPAQMLSEVGVVAGGARAAGLADRLGQRHQIVAAGWRWLEVAVIADQIPASWRGQPPGMLLAQVVGVRLGEGGQRTHDSGRVGIEEGQRRDGRPGAAVAGAAPW